MRDVHGRSAEVTEALRGCRDEEPEAFDRLVTLLYADLRRLARGQLRRLRPGQTLDTTGLVNELYLKLAGADPLFVDRQHFLSASARAMRHILVNTARRKLTAKRGGGQRAETLDDQVAAADRLHDERVVAVSAALDRLQDFDARMCTVVECRFFAGMTEEETGEALGVSARTVRRDWLRAKAWLSEELAAKGSAGPSGG